eukprot:5936783-Pleurochrysis_carterae.AAC.1
MERTIELRGEGEVEEGDGREDNEQGDKGRGSRAVGLGREEEKEREEGAGGWAARNVCVWGGERRSKARPRRGSACNQKTRDTYAADITEWQKWQDS